MIKRAGDAFRAVQPRARFLWHFIRWNQLFKLKTFLQGGLWLARLDQFNDPLEGTLPDPNLGLLRKLLPPTQVPATVHEYELAAKRGYASCWHMSDHEPAGGMWEAKFGNRGKGVALRTTPARFASALNHLITPNGPFYLGEVRYIDHQRDQIPEANTIECAFVVQSGFAWQTEARVYVHLYGINATESLCLERSVWGQSLVREIDSQNSFSGKREFVGFIPKTADGDSNKKDGLAMAVRCAPSLLIEEILVGPRVSETEYQSLVEVINGSSYCGPVRRLSDLESNG
jgi:hypothetical protein